MEPRAMKYREDTELARRAATGDLPAWHEFVLRYSALIRVIVRRYYPGWPEDDQLNVYVQVLEYLHAQGLGRYDGRAALSTWVMTVTRSRCCDALRHELGRRRPPKWVQELPALEREIYQLHVVEGLAAPALQERLRRRGFELEEEELDRAIEALSQRLDRPSQRRMAYDREARSVGALSGRVLETMDQLRLELEELAEAARPDHALFEARTRALLGELEGCVERLNGPERQIIELRFYREMSAPGIAERLNLPGPRQVYSLINRALALLRDMLERRIEPPLAGDGGAPLGDSAGGA